MKNSGHTSTDRPEQIFRDRREAGRVLGELLEAYRGDPRVVVLGLARGGVPVAWEVAAALGAALDAFVVRKLGVPGREELAMGALASGGVVVLNDDLVRDLAITPEQLRRVVDREGRELVRREAAYRGNRPPTDVAGKIAILVDDGLATGASMHAAVDALREQEPEQIVVAVPAAPESTCRDLRAVVDDVVCATMPFPFRAVGDSFWNFAQVTDEEVRTLLRTPTVGPGTPNARILEFNSAAGIVRLASREAPDGVPAPQDLLDLVGDARIVLIGESSHGTHEFYAARAEITRRLIEEKGFTAVAAEADWPDAYRVNRYVRGHGSDTSAEEALRGFQRFPAWMWRNTVVRDFVAWLREHNDRCATDGRDQTGFYGLDLYSLHRSMREVIDYLDRVDPAAAQRARARYSCFEHVSGEDGQAYGYAAAFGAGESCEQQVVDQLVDLQHHALEYARRGGILADDDQFYAERNAWSVRDAEEYYRTMFGGRVSSWNLRDRHMADTLDALIAHLDRRLGSTARVVVWAHNSHVGDARATEVGTQGELTVGQLVRERYRDDCRLIGFSTYAGTVTAASEWGGPAERKVVRAALPSSVEELFHEVGKDSFLVRTDHDRRTADTLRVARLERAIGVIYRPETERQSHYFYTRLSDQFDAVIHIDTTHALEPLERTSLWVEGEMPETYPFAL
ncbi:MULTISPECIES: erythromycin esterase family protein [Rhodococcus]|uniref:erythromycin esterase family protein n=1 Tax=Rhodococcus TaxID=1827 RepID=UPI0006853E01|nr:MULTISPECIES: erythromycin esterase family protein [Rhodococcus]QQZ19659.1 erythromycin esterase family protein [Rhodococcus sp. 21391]